MVNGISVFQYLLMLAVMFFVTLLLCELQAVPVIKNGQVVRLKRHKAETRFIYCVLLFAILVFYFALRSIGDGGLGGKDSVVYRRMFVESIDFSKHVNAEVGYLIFEFAVRIFTDNFYVYLIVYYFVLMMLIININKHVVRSEVAFPMTFIFITLILMFSLCLMRNVLSYFLAYNSLLYYSRKRKIKGTLFLLFAVGCHTSALFLFVGIVLYRLFKMLSFNPILSMVCLMIVFVAVLFGKDIYLNLVGARYVHYIEQENTGISFGQLGRFIPVYIICLFLISQIRRKSAKTSYYWRHISQIASTAVLYPVSAYFGMVYRMFFYTSYSRLMITNETYRHYVKYSKIKDLFVALTYVFMIIEIALFIRGSIGDYGLLPILPVYFFGG